MNQSEFIYETKPQSQCDRILHCLKENIGSFVSMPLLAEVSGAYAVHSRIADLRRRGHTIEQRSERKPGGTVASYYKLEL